MRTIDTVLMTEAKLPVYKTPGAAGADLFAYLQEPLIIQPGEIKEVPSGVKLDIQDEGLAMFLLPRSSLGKKRIKLANTIGLIDSDYQGDVTMLLENAGTEPFVVNNGDRLAQVVFVSVEQVQFYQVPSFRGVTIRGEGAFGSTGN